MFFNKFGKCKKKEDGVCPFIHDPEKIAVCRKFLQGNCFKDACLLSHKVAPEKMPVCKYYLEGLCSKDPCPYRHVKVSDSAEICPDFLKGFCPLYDNCMKRHENQPKPSTSKTGNESTTNKKVAPIKPKRKSIGATPNIVPHEVLKDKKKRYFEEEEAKTPVVASTSVSAAPVPAKTLTEKLSNPKATLTTSLNPNVPEFVPMASKVLTFLITYLSVKLLCEILLLILR